ncbi:32231_t:CDS:2, partial [Gigaspora margarita]
NAKYDQAPAIDAAGHLVPRTTCETKTHMLVLQQRSFIDKLCGKEMHYENCRICGTPLRDGVNDNPKVVVICNNRHAFHEDCIQKWFNRLNIPRT